MGDGQNRTRTVIWRAPGLVNVPMPSISTLTVSPSTIGPTPAGVPVRITSPGSNVMMSDMNAISARDVVDHLAGAPVLPELAVDAAVTRRSDGSSTVSIHGPIGQNES